MWCAVQPPKPGGSVDVRKTRTTADQGETLAEQGIVGRARVEPCKVTS